MSKGDVVVLDNVGFHKSERAAQLIKQRGARLLFLPAYYLNWSGKWGVLPPNVGETAVGLSPALSCAVWLAQIRNYPKASGLGRVDLGAGPSPSEVMSVRSSRRFSPVCAPRASVRLAQTMFHHVGS
ncbi:hypothetical protein [Rhizobium sp. IBUN]|uniref:hypothetical protein n=1 Tax=Rhizobium sp. IBUN TaxID=1042326 RepID=UPI0032AFB7A7